MTIQLPLHMVCYTSMQTYCFATWTVGSSSCGLWQGVCTYPLYCHLFKQTLREHPMCRHSPNKYDNNEWEVIEGVIECSWMSDNNWVIYTHINLIPKIRRRTALSDISIIWSIAPPTSSFLNIIMSCYFMRCNDVLDMSLTLLGYFSKCTF